LAHILFAHTAHGSKINVKTDSTHVYALTTSSTCSY